MLFRNKEVPQVSGLKALPFNQWDSITDVPLSFENWLLYTQQVC